MQFSGQWLSSLPSVVWQGRDIDSRWARSPVRAEGHGTERSGGLVAEYAEGVDTAREWTGTTNTECLMRTTRSSQLHARSSSDIYIRPRCPDKDDRRKCNSTAHRATRQLLATFFDFCLYSICLFSRLSAMETFAIYVVLVRCLRCRTTEEPMSMDVVLLHGHVGIGHNSVYCTDCEEKTGHPGIVQVN